MTNQKISVIVPVYKVEKYLDKCVESIVNQTHTNLEIILVDDGSPDNCPKMCDDWAKKDKRIKVIHKQNGGVADARNTGINASTGKYIAFVDSDDFIHPTMYQKLIEKITKCNCDICMCGFTSVNEDGSQKHFKEINRPNVTSKNIIKYFLSNSVQEKDSCFETFGLMGNVWRILIKKEIIKNTRFQKLKIAEDLLFLINIITDNTKICSIDDYLYYYLQRQDSVMHKFNKQKVDERYKAFKIIFEEIKTRVDCNSLSAFKFYNYASLTNEMLKFKQFDLLKEYMKDDFFKSLNTKQNFRQELKNTKSLKRKIGYFLVHKKMFKLYSLLVKN